MGQFRQADTADPRRWLLVANRSLTVQPAVGQVSEFDPVSGTYRPVSLAGGTFACGITAGTARLYLLAPPL